MDVQMWAKGAAPGQVLVYATRSRGDIEYGFETKTLPSAYRAHSDGLVFLAQRRKGDGYEYIAVRISAETRRILRLGEEREPVVRRPHYDSYEEWGEEHLRVLTEDFKAGKPASFTANKLGRTRHSVVGKRTRLGLVGG